MSVGLVSCSKLKLAHAAPARDLYTSQLFRAAREYCESAYNEWYILSALHGVLRPETVIAPYDKTLLSMSAPARRLWGWHVRNDLRMLFPNELPTFYMHAGRVYSEAVDLEAWRWSVEYPLAHLGIGQQLAWYAVERSNAPSIAPPRPLSQTRQLSLP